MAGPKGVVNLLQQFLKAGASSGTLDAALGACKVGLHQLLLGYEIWNDQLKSKNVLIKILTQRESFEGSEWQSWDLRSQHDSWYTTHQLVSHNLATFLMFCVQTKNLMLQ